MQTCKYVDANELLYRFFRANETHPNDDHYTKEKSDKIGEPDKIVIERAAFSSGNPSVDRAKLTRCPKDTRVRSSDGVMGIWAKDVKGLTLIDYPNYTVNVKKTPDYENDNKAHAEIVLFSGEDSITRSVSRQFRKLLAEISVCIIEPIEPNPLE